MKIIEEEERGPAYITWWEWKQGSTFWNEISYLLEVKSSLPESHGSFYLWLSSITFSAFESNACSSIQRRDSGKLLHCLRRCSWREVACAFWTAVTRIDLEEHVLFRELGTKRVNNSTTVLAPPSTVGSSMRRISRMYIRLASPWDLMLSVLHSIKQLRTFVCYGRARFALMRVITSIRSLSGTTHLTLDLQILTEAPFYRV